MSSAGAAALNLVVGPGGICHKFYSICVITPGSHLCFSGVLDQMVFERAEKLSSIRN